MLRFRLIAVALILSCGKVYVSGDAYDYDDSHTLDDRMTMIEMQEWTWPTLASECENFLQYYKYGAVHVSPPQEHIVITETINGKLDMPWWVKYQPVSYMINGRAGTQQQFTDMVNRCNKVGVRIIVDIVLNHMVGVNQKGNGWAGTAYNTENGAEQFIYYSNSDFNDPYCDSKDGGVDNYNDASQVWECKLSGLVDLNQGLSNVRQQMITYLNQLLNIGVAGFRMDAAKNMQPDDIQYILDHVNSLNSSVFGNNKRPFVVQEVIDTCGTCEAVTGDMYLDNGRITNFRYGLDLCNAVKRQNGGNFKNLYNFGPGWNYWNDNDVLVFVDNHDNQRSGDGSVLTYKDGNNYIMGVTYMLAWPYGYPRVMSSYYFTASDQGPPTVGAPTWAVTPPTFNPDDTCNSNSGWVCEHRWPAIRRMAAFRSVVMFEAAMDIVTQSNRIAWRRGNRGFFALNNDPSNTWTQSFQTGLPAGTYCDVISGEPQSSGGCSAVTVTVDSNGMSTVSVKVGQTFAIHLYSKAGTSPTVPPVIPKPTPPSVGSNYQRTAVFMQKATTPGENLFVLGGLDTSKNSGCSTTNSNCENDKCAMPIVHQTQVNKYFATYIDWAQNDHCLDWYGAEPNQGTYDGTAALGSPMAYTTNNKTDPAYNPLNNFGPGYWLIDMKMDCTKTLNGWFELKGYLQNGDGWETNRQQSGCSGTGASGSPPYQGQNHFAKCGYDSNTLSQPNCSFYVTLKSCQAVSRIMECNETNSIYMRCSECWCDPTNSRTSRHHVVTYPASAPCAACCK